MSTTETFPFSIFESVTKPIPTETVELDFEDFSAIMYSFKEEEFSAKSAAPLFSSTLFNNNRRSKANATESGLIVLDVDDGQTIEETLAMVDDLNVMALLYSTASHRCDHHKFRLCIPLATRVSYQDYSNCWHSLNFVFAENNSDQSKVGCESLFYVPGQYPDAPSVFECRDGIILTADEWLEIADVPIAATIVKTKEPPASRSHSNFKTTQKLAGVNDLDFFETKLISETALTKYQSANGNWHHARFGLMMSIAGRASIMGIAIAADDIIHLFNQVDLADGGHYQSQKHQTEIANDAANALASAARG